MAIRSATLYQGEDMTPVLDYTDQVIWEESEFGTRAWQGEGSASTVVIRDPLGEQGNFASLPAGLTAKSLASKNLFVIQLGTDYMFRGRVGIKNYSRDGQQIERYRQVECQLHDTNWDLDHIFVHDYVRPAETDIARAQGVIASYLSGFPRESTALNGSNFLSGSNSVSLAANTYTQTSPLGVLREVAVTANKQFFVTGDTLTGGSLFWDGNDSTAYLSGLRISDRLADMNTTGACTGTAPTIHSSGYTSGAGPIGSGIPAGLIDSALYVFSMDRHDDVGGGPDEWQDGAITATYDGVAMTKLATIRHPVSDTGYAGAGASSIGVFRMLSPPSGLKTLSVLTADGGQQRNSRVWVLLQNVSQTNPEGDIQTNSGTSAKSSVSVAGGGRLVLDNAFVYMLIAGTVAAPTATHTVLDTGITDRAGADFEHGVGTGSNSPVWTFLDATRKWVAAAVAVNGPALGTGSLTFPPIWNVGPASTEDGAEQLDEVKLFYGTGTDSYVTAHDPVTHTQYGHSSETFTDDTIATEAEAQTKANSILAHRRFEDKTYNVTIGPLTDEQVLCVRHGQLIQIKARAIPDADDAFRSMRIAQCRYTTPIVGIWFAHLQLGRPWKMQPYSKGPPLTPKSAGSGDTPDPIGLTGDPGTDTGTFANSDHSHGHGTFGTNDLHTEYVREPILTTAGDMPYASGTSVWTRLPIGSSNFHMVSDGAVPLWQPQSAAAGGSGGLTVDKAGKTTVGGNWEVVTQNRELNKKVTVTNAGKVRCLAAYLKGDSSGVRGFAVALKEDNAGAIGMIISSAVYDNGNYLFLTGTGRWIEFPLAGTVTATDYWITIMEIGGNGGHSIDYATGGSDRRTSQGGAWFADGTLTAETDTTFNYGMYVEVMRT